MDTIATLIEEKSQITKRLERMLYGSVEIRDSGGKKYLYTHLREDGIPITKYIGEYTAELHNLILENNILAKDVKKRLRVINKKLKEANYIETDMGFGGLAAHFPFIVLKIVSGHCRRLRPFRFISCFYSITPLLLPIRFPPPSYTSTEYSLPNTPDWELLL